MTALKEYARLESTGVWRESAEAQRRDVIVAFGDASLVISGTNNAILSHWSLAALHRLNPGKRPAVYTPGGDAVETLEITDAEMVEAIEKVRTLIARRRPQPGRLRVWLLAGALAAVAAFLIFWVPPALLRHTLTVLPPATREELGADLLAAIVRVSGAPCTTERGDAALARLATRLLGPGGGRIVVLPGGVRETAHLPGGVILVNSALVEDHETPDVVAGFVLAEALRREAGDPVARLLREAGVMATVRLLTTGDIRPDLLEAHAEALLTTPPPPLATDALLARFAARHVPSTPYAYAVDISGEATLPLIEADPMWSGGADAVLDDADWVSLQGICGG